MSKHLWEIDHPYYGPTSCWYADGSQARADRLLFGSWGDFADSTEGEAFGAGGNVLYDFDDDLNFLYRWDWKRADPEDFYLKPGDPDDQSEEFALAQETDTLCLFYMLQRKGRMVYAEVEVTEADEPAVREWLAKKAAYMATMWEPFLEVSRD